VIAALQPLLEPSYDPLRQGISEFVHTGAAAIVLVGFVSWALSLALLGNLVAEEPARGPRRSARLESAALFAAAVGLGLVTFFATDRGAEVAGAVTQTTVPGHLHDAGSALVTIAIPIAVVADGWRERDPRLAAAVIVASLLSSAVLFALGDPLPGLRQRCLVVCACLWQLAVLRRTHSRLYLG
jgi:Protein of unknown function (DUF998)